MAPYATEFQPDRHVSLSISSGASFSSSFESDFDPNVILHLAPLPLHLPERPASPYDQALPSILQEVTGVDDLRSVFELKLKVLSNEMSLSKLHIYVPQLMILDLSGSFLQSLRDLGCNLTNLKVLKVDRCSLDSLDGVFGLSSVIELSAAYNRIEDLSPAIFLENLKTLNLRGNCIPDLSFLEFLHELPLENLTLAENPAGRSSLYSQNVQRVLPQLKCFDGKQILPPLPGPSISRDTQPSLWAIQITQSFEQHSNCTEPARPQSARPASSRGPLSRKLHRTFSLTDLLKETILEDKTSMEATREELNPISRLTSGGVVCGNLALAWRRNRRTRPDPVNRNEEEMRVLDVDEGAHELIPETNPATSPSTSEPLVKSSSSAFSQSSSSLSGSNETISSSNSNSLINASQRWRQAFSLFQEKSLISWKKHSIDSEDVSNLTTTNHNEEDNNKDHEDDIAKNEDDDAKNEDNNVNNEDDNAKNEEDEDADADDDNTELSK